MAARGVEPRRLAAPDPKSGVYANFTKRPCRCLLVCDAAIIVLDYGTRL
jgi:hypothetical protein